MQAYLNGVLNVDMLVHIVELSSANNIHSWNRWDVEKRVEDQVGKEEKQINLIFHEKQGSGTTK